MSFSILPIYNTEIWNQYKRQIKSFWTVEEIDFSNDYNDFMTLEEGEKHSIKMILAFFSNSDGLVNINIQNNFLNSFDKETCFTYVFQMFMEQIHNECYSLMIETLIKDSEEKNKLLNSMYNYDIIKEISEWGLLYSNSDVYTLSEKILVFICFEGIMFSGAFAFIYWIKSFLSRGKMFMSGLIKSNEFISRDESMHTEFGIMKFLEQNKKDNVPNFRITKIILECVSLTNKFNRDVLKIKYTGMNEQLMNEYIEYMADRIFVSLNISKFHNTKNPFSFMDTIGMVQKTNFHESRPTEYQRAETNNNTIMFDGDDF